MNDGRRGIVENIPLPAQTSVSVSTGAVSSGVQLPRKETGPSAAAWGGGSERGDRSEEGEAAGSDLMSEHGILHGGKSGWKQPEVPACTWALGPFIG